MVWFLLNLLLLHKYQYESFLGHTGDFDAMVHNLVAKYPTTNVVAVGFSLGGNLVTKYMGDKAHKRPDNVIGGISICQGYNAVEWVYILFYEFIL